MQKIVEANSLVAIVVLNGFSTLSLGSVIEPLRFVADEFPGIFSEVVLVALDEGPVRSSGGAVLKCELVGTDLIRRMSTGRAPKALFICSNTVAAPENDKKLSIILRLANIMGVKIYVLGSVTKQIAKMGFLKGKNVTAHWKSLAAFVEQHDEVGVTNALFVDDEEIASCPGETAAIDLVISLIADLSPKAATDVANHFLISHPRPGKMAQPGSQNHRLRSMPQKLAEAVQLMSENIEDPVNISDIAILCEISARRLERLFRKHLGTSPLRYYTSLKLERALELVTQTNLSSLEIALASGFSSASAMSKKFKEQYGKIPSECREKSKSPAVLAVTHKSCGE